MLIVVMRMRHVNRKREMRDDDGGGGFIVVWCVVLWCGVLCCVEVIIIIIRENKFYLVFSLEILNGFWGLSVGFCWG